MLRIHACTPEERRIYTVTDRRHMYSVERVELPRITRQPGYEYSDPTRPITRAYSVSEMRRSNGRTVYAEDGKGLYHYNEKPLLNTYILRRTGPAPLDNWTGPVCQQPVYRRPIKPLEIREAVIATTQVPALDVIPCLKPQPIRLIPTYFDNKAKNVKGHPSAFPHGDSGYESKEQAKNGSASDSFGQ
ncbi:hypothetical protein GMRT_14306 [Giardia muris]|uniref:Uncharacterized protein n=1 Tax=Giardia muris TaxID=5742 RepID=A0A4Z1T7T3_GIAMU|nr:hypothetical protein GMRT_14306 [Giardia muris]|eukprot:TNJ30153.1 hypothetical protein GMRT_14306 [Giardia muris]